MELELSAEQRRLERLRDLEILDTPEDPRFERIMRLAMRLFPGFQCAVVFVDDRRVWAKATEKHAQCEYSKDQSFCGFAVQSGEQLQLEDTLEETRFMHLDAVRKAGIRFYANRLLRTLDGTVVGSVCLRDTKPHTFSDDDHLNLDLLGAMANETLAEIEDVTNEPQGEGNVVPVASGVGEVFEQSPLAMAYLTFPDLKYQDVNRAALVLLGHSRKEIEGTVFDDHVSESDGAMVRHLRSQLELRRKTAQFEFSFDTGIGEERIVLLVAQLVERDGQPCVLMFFQDVTRARVREKKTRWLFEGTSAYTGVDFFRYCCESVARMTGGNLVAISRLVSRNHVSQLCLWHNGRFLPTGESDITGAPCERVLQGENVFIGDNLASASGYPLYQQMGLRSFNGVPIRGASSEILGHLAVMGESAMLPDPDREPMLTAISSRIASEILRADAEAFRRDDLRRAKLLQRISREIRKSLQPDTILTTAAEEIGVAFRTSRCQIYLVEDQCSGAVPPLAQYLAPDTASPPFPALELGEGSPFSGALSADDPLVISDYRMEVLSPSTMEVFEANEVVSVLAVRISNRTVTSGLIVLHQCDSARTWRRQDIVLLEAIADQLGIGLAHAKALISEQHRTQELLVAQEKAEAASRAKGDFLARMSHELRTPLNSILGFSKLLESDADLTDHHLETLRIINRSGEHLLSLISDVLEMSKIEAGQMEVDAAPMSLWELIDTISDMFQFRAETNELDFLIERERNLPQWIHSDQKKLRQVLTNLLGNAFKFTRKGQVRLSVSRFGDVLTFTVSDSGCGITAEEIPKLFKVFSQTQEGRHSTEGTGLGLAISKGFVELLGGSIEVASTSGEGAAFSFYVPLVESAAPEIRSASVTADSVIGIKSGAGLKLLIADDQFENRLFLKRFLTKLGFAIVEAVDGQHAMEMVEQENPDGVLMDIRMPVMDGIESTKALRSSGYTKPIIALTGNAFEEDRQFALSSGCSGFLAKPIDFDVLLRTLQEQLPLEFDVESQPSLAG